MNYKRYGRRQSWSKLRYYPGICVEGLRETTEKPQSEYLFPGRDLTLGAPEYEAAVLSTGNATFSLFMPYMFLESSSRG
jgi:hypothetical protein